LESEAEDRGVSRSAYIRDVLESRRDAQELERKVERLKNQLRAANSRHDEHTELIEYVERERELQQLERERRTASIWERARWLLFGRD